MSRLEQLERMLVTEPNDSFLNFAFAMELAKAGRTADALARFDRVIALDAHYTAAHFQKGRTLLNGGEVEAAKAALREGIARAQECGNGHAAAEMGELLSSLS